MIHFHEVAVVIPPVMKGETEKVLLEGISLELAEQRVAVIGANGSGKSTLLRLINGMRRPTSGVVTVNGLDTVADAAKVRREVGFIFTDPLAQLLMSSPIEDLELSCRYIPRPQRRAHALALLAERGLDGLAHQSIYDLSGGERQLVALTSVLAVEPSVIVADEPTTLLDLRNRVRLRRTLAELPQQVILSTHDMQVAAEAERVIVIDGGRVAADGAPAETIAWYEKAMS
ncbi:MAG: ABC transporter ATP-binding protein [Propionibacteriaceae bacterium]|nr:ABC transporter ATP-binding protein [Propionibacteriaceae bacterium]